MDLKENTCVIFKNAKKETDAQPEYKGQVNVEGKLFDIALWVKTSEKGTKYFSGKVSEPYRKEETHEQVIRQVQEEKAKPEPEEFTDDLPF